MLSRLYCVDPQQFAEVWVDGELDHVLSQEFEYSCVSSLETYVEGIFVVRFEFVQMVE